MSIIRPNGNQITTSDHLITKHQDQAASTIERLRTLAGSKVASDSGLFHVPLIITFDDSEGRIDFHRIREPHTLRHELCHGPHPHIVISQVAVILATIHNGMSPVSRSSCEDNSGFCSKWHKSPRVPLHGDFGLGNILLDQGGDSLFVIDWAQPAWVPCTCSIGPPSYDVAMFLISLFETRLLSSNYVSNREGLADIFLSKYCEESSATLCPKELSSIVKTLSSLYRRWSYKKRGRFRTLARHLSSLRLALYLHRFPRRRISV